MASTAGVRPLAPAGSRWPSIGEIWTLLAWALPALASLLVPMPAVDLAYQLRVGGEILASGAIPATDSWTFTAFGQPWLDQQWGAQVILAGIFQVAGWTGLAVLRAALVAVTFGFVERGLRRVGCGRRQAAMLTLLSFIVASPALALRPQLFGIVLFAAAAWIVLDRRIHPRRLLFLPLIAVAWANVHGSFPLLLVLIGLGWFDEVLRRHAERASRPAARGVQLPPSLRATDRLPGSTGVALFGGIALLATVVNPFGIDVWRYIASLASNPAVSEQVSEWRPPLPWEPVGALFYASVAVVLLVVVVRLRRDGGGRFSRMSLRTASIPPLATLLVFGVLGAFTGRGLAWWALVAPVAAATLAHEPGLADGIPRFLTPLRTLLRSTGREDRRSPLNGAVIGVLTLAAVALLPLWRPLGPAGVPIGTLTYAPQGIAAFLAERSEGRDVPNVWAPQTWTSFLEWAAPGARYGVDSRIELFSADLWQDVARLTTGHDVEDALGQYAAASYVVAPAGAAALRAAMGTNPEWTLVYEDADGSIWSRPVIVPGG